MTTFYVILAIWLLGAAILTFFIRKEAQKQNIQFHPYQLFVGAIWFVILPIYGIIKLRSRVA